MESHAPVVAVRIRGPPSADAQAWSVRKDCQILEFTPPVNLQQIQQEKQPASSPARSPVKRSANAASPAKQGTPARPHRPASGDSNYSKNSGIGIDNGSSNGGSQSRRSRESLRSRSFLFDRVFDAAAKSYDVYTQVASALFDEAVAGVNATLFAYGQTGSGKTHTMLGDSDHEESGLIPLGIRHVFAAIEATPDREFLLQVSYCEIYNEVVNDLLSPQSVNLRVREGQHGFYVENLSKQVVVSEEHIMAMLASGEMHRHIGSTDFNLQSSRSHTLFQLIIESKSSTEERDGLPSAIRRSELCLIDLAGSERVSKQLGTKNELRQQEGSYINKSLLTLGTVISRLSDLHVRGRSDHIPYRDSKLTRILQPALSGNAKVLLIATMSPLLENFEETLSTLKFAERAKNVQNTAKVNELVDDKTLLRRYEREIADLRVKLSQVPDASKISQEKDSKLARLEKEKAKLTDAVLANQGYAQKLQNKIEALERLILTSSQAMQHSTRTGSLLVDAHSGAVDLVDGAGQGVLPQLAMPHTTAESAPALPSGRLPNSRARRSSARSSPSPVRKVVLSRRGRVPAEVGSGGVEVTEIADARVPSRATNAVISGRDHTLKLEVELALALQRANDAESLLQTQDLQLRDALAAQAELEKEVVALQSQLAAFMQ